MTQVPVTPVIFETQELFDLDITLQSAGYEIYASGNYGTIRTKHYLHPATLNKLTISENLNENLVAI